MREDHMLDEDAKLVGEWGKNLDFFAEHALGDADVADHLALEGVGKTRLPGEFADFADVVKDGSGDEKVGVDLGVEGNVSAADADQGENVLEEAADPGVVETFGRGGTLIGGADVGV